MKKRRKKITMYKDSDVTLSPARSPAPKVKSYFNHTWQHKANLFSFSCSVTLQRCQRPSGSHRGAPVRLQPVETCCFAPTAHNQNQTRRPPRQPASISSERASIVSIASSKRSQAQCDRTRRPPLARVRGDRTASEARHSGPR